MVFSSHLFVYYFLPLALAVYYLLPRRGPSFGLEITKRMVLRETMMDLDSALSLETEIQAACMEDPNFREAYEAFVAKRRPRFD